MKHRTFLALLATLLLVTWGIVIKRAIGERRKPVEVTEHALVDSYMWRSDTPHKPQYGDIILTASKDTSVCWIEVPCDSNALYKWHVKEIQRLQKKRLWGSHKHKMGDFSSGFISRDGKGWYSVDVGVCDICNQVVNDTTRMPMPNERTTSAYPMPRPQDQ